MVQAQCFQYVVNPHGKNQTKPNKKTTHRQTSKNKQKKIKTNKNHHHHHHQTPKKQTKKPQIVQKSFKVFMSLQIKVLTLLDTPSTHKNYVVSGKKNVKEVKVIHTITISRLRLYQNNATNNEVTEYCHIPQYKNLIDKNIIWKSHNHFPKKHYVFHV